MLCGKRLLGCLGLVFLALLPGAARCPVTIRRMTSAIRPMCAAKAWSVPWIFTGAAGAFQDALETSPRSAAAHYQLAWLYENKLADPAAAIYHYQEYLRLDPKAGNPDVIRQHIYACKQQLAKDIMELPAPRRPAAA